mmetsp:Transcript_32026/g.38784  ORF Transcript_32026/g.38784 Transcript_32026/m.38784 type:complete len:412 (+) Transcript_32026:105-1340(+)|eukprot:CAMPEP_0197858518 /NCGR_PEP_ID=MMETSP1438-20131217/32365_1 /TAXON_ID=1461541 /ORGANISM="Pterosperma sp., Strain CCMP1384" /LENGTH=411 /DNA_ID=CAMNT_0043474701 /DNA_START=96 /DNA_END=1331 /DNA_ORIENTATION=+
MATYCLSTPRVGQVASARNSPNAQQKPCTRVKITSSAGPKSCHVSSLTSTSSKQRAVLKGGVSFLPARRRTAQVACSADAAAAGEVSAEPPVPAWAVKLGAFTAFILPISCPLATATGLLYPPSFAWFGPAWWAPGLGAMMFAAAIKLTVKDFARVVQAPQSVLLGIFANWSIKVALALLFVKLLGLQGGAAIGLLMVGAVSPSALSNYAVGVGMGNVALSVTVVSVSTLAAVGLTPALAQAMIGAGVSVSPSAMAQTILKVIVFPTFLGLFLNEMVKPVARLLQPFSGLVGTVATALVLGGAVSMHGHILFTSLGAYMVPVTLVYHALAYIGAYFMCKSFGANDRDTRAITLVTGMQSSTMATVLCTKFFPDVPTAMISTVLSTIVMANSGLWVATAWQRFIGPPAEEEK